MSLWVLIIFRRCSGGISALGVYKLLLSAFLVIFYPSLIFSDESIFSYVQFPYNSTFFSALFSNSSKTWRGGGGGNVSPQFLHLFKVAWRVVEARKERILIYRWHHQLSSSSISYPGSGGGGVDAKSRHLQNQEVGAVSPLIFLWRYFFWMEVQSAQVFSMVFFSQIVFLTLFFVLAVLPQFILLPWSFK